VLAPREIDEYILPTERRIIRVREHWAVMLNPILQSAAVLLLIVVAERTLPDSVFLDNLAFYGALVVVVRFTILVLLWWVERIVVTDKRVMKSEGIIVHKVGMMPLSKVTDLSFVRSLTGRIFGYGKIVIESAGQNQAFDEIDYIPRPEEIYEALTELVFGEKRQTRSGLLPPPRRRGR
jgi:uncharacterized membrane protein YdbT with pleckstrin-like domain